MKTKAQKFMAVGVMKEMRNRDSEIVYKKTGAQIQESLKAVILNLKKDGEDFKGDISRLCKVRDIDVKEVLEAGTDSEEVQNYSSKAFANVPGKAKGLYEELQRDLVEIQNLVSALTHCNGQIEYFEKVTKNIEPERSFDLSYNELLNFGF